MPAFIRIPPADTAGRLIVALDVDDVASARRLVVTLGDAVSFYKIGYWLLFNPDANALIDGLVRDGKKLFLDAKMYDIAETVRRGVAAVAQRGISFVTVHGDRDIMAAAVDGRGAAALKIFAVTVLTSLDDSAVAAMGYAMPVRDLIRLRVRAAVECGCDGVIASPTDSPDELRAEANAGRLLVATPGVRMPDDARDDHARPGSPATAVLNGADYLVVGRPITRHDAPRKKAEQIIADMRRGQASRLERDLSD